MTDYHESWDALPEQARDIHRAITSLKEEIEAVDWYHQRVVMCSDPQLCKILAHNRDEEIEHAVMTLEWLRRNMPKWDENLRTYLFTEGDITEIEEAEEGKQAGKQAGKAGGEASSEGDLGIGKPRGS
ncbi:MAG: ferritin-like domain-containing protein [Enhygromyxa sp.]